MFTATMAERPVSDDALALRAQGGDREALRTLIRHLYPGVLAFVSRMLRHEEDARDVAQDVFLRMTAHLGDYRGEYKFSTWLFRIAINRAHDVLRGRGRKPAGLDDLPEAGGGLTGPDGLISNGEDRDRVLDAVRDLPETVRGSLLLAYQVGLSHSEIGDLLGISTNAAKLRVHKALRLLRARLKEKP